MPTSFSLIQGTDINDDMLEVCAALFSNHYGVWGESAAGRPHLRPNGRIRMNASRLKTVILSNPDVTVLSTCTIDGEHVGHAFATTWEYGKNEDAVLWITQLVVHRAHRRRYIATTLLQQLKLSPLFKEVKVAGIVSSQPASCNALAKLALPHASMGSLDLSFLAKHAHEVLRASPIEYLRSARLRGSVFTSSEDGEPGVVCVADTDFPVDHGEPEAALREYREEMIGAWACCLNVAKFCSCCQS